MIRVGCCGFPVRRALYYATFDVVEVQQTFYQVPRLETARRWREEAPAHRPPGARPFVFTMKAWQLITHAATSPTYRRLREPLTEAERAQVGGFRWTDPVRRAWDRTRQFALALGAEAVLFQCPASFRPTPEHLEALERFFREVDRAGLLFVWEPRGRWPRRLVADLCRQLDLIHGTDPLKAPSVTPGLRYWRLHGTTGYRHRYTEAELERLAALCPKRRDAYVLFNNVAMWDDARRFLRHIGRAGK